jgi:hypothetical protein
MLLRQLFFSPKTTTLNPSRAVFDLTTYIFAPKRRDDCTKPLNIIVLSDPIMNGVSLQANAGLHALVAGLRDVCG